MSDPERRIKTIWHSPFEPPEITYERVPDPDDEGEHEWQDEHEDDDNA